MLLTGLLMKKQTRKDVTLSLNRAVGLSNNGNVHLLSKQSGKISIDQAATVRLALRKSFKKQAKIWNFLLSYSNVTKKPNEIRLGKGKGNIKYKATTISSGQSLFAVKLLRVNTVAVQAVKQVRPLISTHTVLCLKNERWIL